MKRSFQKVDIICMLLGVLTVFMFCFSIADSAAYGALSRMFAPKVEASAEAVTATGGFGANFDMMTSYDPSLRSIRVRSWRHK